ANADLDNLRRRTERELENAHKYALERFAQELLAVRDSLEMGVIAAEQEEASVEKIKEGTELTLKMLESAMQKFNIQAIDPQDEPFNPELHQAMSMVETPDKAPNTVINVMQKGYMLNDRLIRPAMVIVSRAPEGKQGG
ncbi:MAG: nucleotide exchange factor GrpE, partial [Thiohalophilus sp.]